MYWTELISFINDVPAADVGLPQVFHPREGEDGVKNGVRRDVHLALRFLVPSSTKSK